MAATYRLICHGIIAAVFLLAQGRNILMTGEFGSLWEPCWLGRVGRSCPTHSGCTHWQLHRVDCFLYLGSSGHGANGTMQQHHRLLWWTHRKAFQHEISADYDHYEHSRSQALRSLMTLLAIATLQWIIRTRKHASVLLQYG
jgi:hypothetical protein